MPNSKAKPHSTKMISPDVKENAKLLLASGETLTATAEKLGLPLSTVATWNNNWKNDPEFKALKIEEHKKLVSSLRTIRDKAIRLTNKRLDIALEDPTNAKETLKDAIAAIDSMCKQIALIEGTPTENINATGEIEIKRFEDYN